MKKFLTVLLAILAIALPAASQTQVKWRTAVRMTSDTEGVVTVKAIIPEGFHLYGTTVPEGGPVATTFDFGASKGVKFRGDMSPSSVPVTARDEAFGIDLQWWTGPVAFPQHFTITDPATAQIVLKIKYMMCNGTNCMPPRTENITIPNTRLKKK